MGGYTLPDPVIESKALDYIVSSCDTAKITQTMSLSNSRSTS